MSPIVVVGGGGHAKVLISVLRKLGQHRILGYTDPRDRGAVLEAPFLGTDAVLEEIARRHERCQAAIGVGTVGSAEPRARIAEALAKLGFELPPVISPQAVVNEGAEVGPGTVVFDGAVVNSGARIGRCGIVNTHATVEHDCLVGDFVHLASGAVLSGGVEVGSGSFIGAGAVVIQGIRIAGGAIVGAGATVTRDLTEPATYVGTPARKAGSP